MEISLCKWNYVSFELVGSSACNFKWNVNKYQHQRDVQGLCRVDWNIFSRVYQMSTRAYFYLFPIESEECFGETQRQVTCWMHKNIIMFCLCDRFGDWIVLSICFDLTSLHMTASKFRLSLSVIITAKHPHKAHFFFHESQVYEEYTAATPENRNN